ncbi:MAG: hypothetical protein ACFFDN_47705 [Candidatus Hodarchaeota archaeon]
MKIEECYKKYFNCDDFSCPYYAYCHSGCKDKNKIPLEDEK